MRTAWCTCQHVFCQLMSYQIHFLTRLGYSEASIWKAAMRSQRHSFSIASINCSFITPYAAKMSTDFWWRGDWKGTKSNWPARTSGIVKCHNKSEVTLKINLWKYTWNTRSGKGRGHISSIIWLFRPSLMVG